MRIILALFSLLFIYEVGKAQSVKKDTLYYLLDTLAVPVKDRLFSYEAENANIKWVTINCACLESGVKPQFRINTRNQKIVDIRWLQRHETVSLSYLLNYLRTKDDARLISNFDLFFIEPNDAHSFKINKVVFAGGKRQLSDDSVIVK